MMKHLGRALCLFTLQSLANNPAWAATYYADYDGGNDAATGLSPDNAFKHAPGDPAARDVAAQTRLTPGDTVIFKGGVKYRGNIVVQASGTADQPITFDGNSAGTFGEGRAILEGGEPVTGWRRVGNADEVAGNRHFRSIYTATVPGSEGLSAQSAGLVQNHQLLYPAQYPNPEELFYSGNAANYLTLERAPSATSLADPRLAEIGGEHLIGGYVYIRTESNFVAYSRITGWDAGTHTLSYEPTRRAPENRYSIVNVATEKVLDGPGQFVFVEKPEADGSHRVFLWPLDNADPSQQEILYNVRGVAFDLQRKGISHITIQGFVIQHYRGAVHGGGHRDTYAEGVKILNNEITRIRAHDSATPISFSRVRNHTIEGNHIHHNPRANAMTTHTGENVVIRNNRIERVGRSPIRFYNVQHGQIVGNRILDSRGVHANPITVYAGCRDILVANNEVHRSNISMTLQNADGIYVINNIFTSPGGAAVGLWPGNPTRNYVFLNNFVGLSDSAFFVNDRNARNMVIKNNVITGIGGYPLDHESHVLSHNLYLAPHRGFREGEFAAENLTDIFADPAGEGFTPLPAGPTVDMGADVSHYYPREKFPDFDFDRDFAGNPRKFGRAIDIGPYEARYEPGALAKRPAIATGKDAEAGTPLDLYTRTDEEPAHVIAATGYTGQGGGQVRHMAAETLATSDFIRFWDKRGHWLDYTIDAPAAGEYTLTMRYAAAQPAQRAVAVNGHTPAGLESVDLEATGGWGTWAVIEFPVRLSLKKGRNTLRLTSVGGLGCNTDELRLKRPDQADIVITAGRFTGQGGHDRPVEVVPSPNRGMIYLWNDEGHWLEWTLDNAKAGKYEVVLRYATLAGSPRRVSVNGEGVEHLEAVLMDRTAGWRVCNEASMPAPIELKDGRNVIRMTSVGGAGFNLDEIRLYPVRPRE